MSLAKSTMLRTSRSAYGESQAMPRSTSKTVGYALLLLAMLGAASASVALGEDYVLGPEDVLTVTVMRHPEMSAESVAVTADGKIHLPVVGEVQVAGMTVEQVRRVITEGLSQRLVSPEVTVAVKQARTETVFVLGAVSSPGVYELKPGWRVTEALAAAGGLTTRPELVAGALFRGGRQVVALDLPTILQEGNDLANLRVPPGDVLNFTERTILISVTGSVLRSGTYDLREGGGVLEAVALAGGVSPEANLGRVTVKKADGSQRSYDLIPAMLRGEPVDETPLAAGDMVIVPTFKARVAVLGAVLQPGYFDLEEGVATRVADMVAQAGGLAARPELVRGSIFRQTGETVPLDLSAVFIEGKSAANLELQAGDIISLIDRTITVDVAGQVEKPGSYELPVGSGVVEAVARAGGVKAPASLTGVILQRKDGATCRVDLFQVMVKGDLGANVPLQHGDLVLVPESKAKVAVLGAVQRPGYYDIDEGVAPTVAQMVAEAGGPLKRARIAGTAVVRSEDGEARRIMVNLARVLRAGRTAEDLPVQAKDIVYVPGEKTDWDLILRSLSAVGGWGYWMFN